MPPSPGAGIDVVVAGAGPAGLATATFAARAGLRTVVCERNPGPGDKACGEGLMPAGVRVLEALGARELLGPEDCSPIEGIRYVEEDGASVTGKLPAGGGLGIRRTALTAALARKAAESGVEIRWGASVTGFVSGRDGVEIETSAGKLNSRLLIAADGLHSPLRRMAGLDGPAEGRERFGMRRHFRIPPWSRLVEVHLSPGVEAFVTPAGASRIGVAFLWEKADATGPVSFDLLLGRFPALAGRLSGARPDSEPRGAGPLAHSVRARSSGRLILVGDAAGYVDAITGEGLSMALVSAERLGALLPSILSLGATPRSLGPYERAASREFLRYSALCRSVLALARRPRLRHQVFAVLRRAPVLLDRVLGLAMA